MQLRYLSVLVSDILVASSVVVAKVYNKYGNKLDPYGKLNSIRYMFSDDNKNGDHSFVCCSLRGETKLSNRLIGLDTLEYAFVLHYNESEDTKTKYFY